MNHEMKLAKGLGFVSEEEKVASALDSMSIEQLEEVLRAEFPKTAQKKAVLKKTASVDLEKIAWDMGREMARKDFEKSANPMAAISGVASKAIGALKGLGGSPGMKAGLGKAMHAATGTPLGKRMAVGAGVGAAGGLLKTPGVDPATGQQGSRLKNMATGAALGAGAGAALKPAAQALGSSNTQIGRMAGGALKREAGMTGNIAARRAATGMQVARGQSMAAANGGRALARNNAALVASGPGI